MNPPCEVSEMGRAFDALGIQCPTTAGGAGLPPPARQQQATPDFGLPLESGPAASANQRASQTAAGSDVTFHLGPNDNAVLLGQQLPAGLQAGQVTALPIQRTKDWHHDTTPEMRIYLVHEVLQAIFPTLDPQATLDERMHNFVAFARKLEGDMYEMANSKSEYYYKLMEKIRDIQEDLEEKRPKRKEQQQMRAAQIEPPQVRPALQGAVAGNFTSGLDPNGNVGLDPNGNVGLDPNGNVGLLGQLPAGLQADQVTASPVPSTKEWHQSVTPELRNHLVCVLAQAICPTPDPRAMLGERMHHVVANARQVEGDIYEMANSRSEYYHLLTEISYGIQNDSEEKRQKQQQQMQTD